MAACQRVVVLLGGTRGQLRTAYSRRLEVVASRRPRQLHLIGRPQEYQPLHVDLVLLIFFTRPLVGILVDSVRLSLAVGVSLGLLQVVVGKYADKSLLLPRFRP